ncbi:Fc receptor-like protein 5 [Fukomys damarensis]|uniref:Fc receptor-like protein 5 n=1 Tax=Fukomys damarensis TaxID=885580 RepID=UPI0008FF090B|nr:Fc receptor-like protein 5 [Fukomys damarensis]
MLLWATLLVLAPTSGQFATAPKPVISLHPPWTTVFQGETVTLTCNGFHFYAPKKTKWYTGNYRGRVLRETSGNILEVRENGRYRCQAENSPLSDPVLLTFSAAPLILQAPLSVFEGDSVVLRCRAKEKIQPDNVKFFKNGELLAPLDENTEFNIHHASLRDNGQYLCTGNEKNRSYHFYSESIRIQVQELFPRPELTASLSQTRDESHVTLSCKTQLHPQKSNVGLQFCFFRNNQALESGCSNSPRLQISAMWNEYSGFYQCKAGTGISGVWKESQISQIHRQTTHCQDSHTCQFYLIRSCCQSPNTLEGDLKPINFSWFKKVGEKKKVMVSSEAKFNILVVQSSDAGEYNCKTGWITSKPVIVNVKVPVSQPVLNFSPRKTHILEGDQVKFHCGVRRGSPQILYQLFREDILLQETKSSLNSASFSSNVSQTGNYYCTVNNGLGPNRSKALTLFVVVPVSQPVLTLHTTEAQTIEGDVLTLHCEAHRGSLPVLYRFYHEDIFLNSRKVPPGVGASFSFSLTAEHSGNYYCTADNGFGPRRSETMSLSVIVPVSLPILTLRMPRDQAVVGDMMELHCEAQRGSPPILYQFYHEDEILGSSQATSGGGASFKLTLTEEHSGNYLCEASNVQKAQRSNTKILSVKVPVSRPVFTLKAPRAPAVVGDVVELRCEALRGSPPILYQFYHEDVNLGNSPAPSGSGASFNLILTTEHSGNYSCEADNGLEVLHSEVMTLRVTVPVSRPVLTLSAPRAQAVVGDEMELHCEALKGSPPILYRFYHENVTLRNDSAFSEGGASFKLFLTEEHSGNYSCEADNGLGAQHSEVVTLFITGLTENRSGAVATGVTGALLSMVGLVAGALLFYFWLSRKAGEKSATDVSRSPSDSQPQETTYHNVPAWIELQPVYINVNPREGDVVYSEVQRNQEKNKHTAASTPRSLRNKESSVIYSQVKVVCTPASRDQQPLESSQMSSRDFSAAVSNSASQCSHGGGDY